MRDKDHAWECSVEPLYTNEHCLKFLPHLFTHWFPTKTVSGAIEHFLNHLSTFPRPLTMGRQALWENNTL